MKKFVLILILSAITMPLIFGQATDIPKSKMFDSKQLLRDVEILADDNMDGRAVGTAGGVKAREYILKRFKEIGLESINSTNEQPFTQIDRQKKELKGANVFGYLKGKKYPDKYFVISAHYDHLGIVKGVVFNGADDDASGTAALFALATYFKKYPTDNSLIFVAFDAEETGLTGSRKFVAAPPLTIEKIVMNLNMDMIGHSDKSELFASGTYHYPLLKPLLLPLTKNSKIKLLFGHDRPEQGNDDWTFQSDHGSFHQQKIPFIYFGVEDHKDYHKSTDDYATLTKPFYVYSVEIILESIKALDKKSTAISGRKQ